MAVLLYFIDKSERIQNLKFWLKKWNLGSSVHFHSIGKFRNFDKFHLYQQVLSM